MYSSSRPHAVHIHACIPPSPKSISPHSYGSLRPLMSTPFPLLSMLTCWMWGASLDRACGKEKGGKGMQMICHHLSKGPAWTGPVGNNLGTRLDVGCQLKTQAAAYTDSRQHSSSLQGES